MKPTEIIASVNAALDADLPAFIWGAPGIGKSDIVRTIGAERGLPVIDLRAVMLDPVDLRGLPAVDGDKVKWLPMGELPDADRDGAEGILLLDELNAAPPMVQAACFQLVLDRRIGTYHLPAGWRIVAAGNRASDRASAQRMPSALANRFMHLTQDADLDSWCQWATGAGIAAPLVAFLRFRPDLLHAFEPDRLVNATPRTWAMASKILDAALPADVELATLAGTIGEGPAAELVAFLRVWRTLPSPDAVLMNPDSAAVPDSAATLWALTGALSRKVTEQTMDALVTYLRRVSPEYGVAAMKDAVARDHRLTSTPGFIAWASANGDIYT